MATVSYTIYSHYDPQESKSPVRSTSHPPDDPDPSDSWQFDPGFKPPPLPAPRFVPATLPAPNWDSGNTHASSSSTSSTNSSAAKDLSSWYRSLTSERSGDQTKPHYKPPSQLPASAPPESTPVEKKNKNNWFIMNAIHSDPSAQLSRDLSSPTLADIIARDPPPLPTEGRFKPPVWLEIGPSNKGFAMLQRSGWSEGEPLGPDVVRQPTVGARVDMLPLEEEKKKKKIALVKQETLEIPMAHYDDVAELRQVDVIDLTLSDAEQELDRDSRLDSPDVKDEFSPAACLHGPEDSHGRTALLTPIATVLKSDRLGIGLKAKTVGPYRASQKRVTHNAAAMAAHIRAAEESRRRKQQYGRGRRGFTVHRKQEEAERKGLLAYMNR
ncbi:hypothetical protein D9615_002906 [Tricholomella constricta]|uniref:G-patch domain-containing protein n=1 Tax=Tricholomella constricta TaxID=117010 RepID=A0A8H5HGC2_9AGAR|nr:hypothetical protein D9615_002906 [Tricholomella constricta]